MSVYYMNQGIKLSSNEQFRGYSSTGRDVMSQGSRTLVSELETWGLSRFHMKEGLQDTYDYQFAVTIE